MASGFRYTDAGAGACARTSVRSVRHEWHRSSSLTSFDGFSRPHVRHVIGHLATMTERKSTRSATRASTRASKAERDSWCVRRRDHATMSTFSTRKNNSYSSPTEDRTDHSGARAATCQKTFQGSPPAERGRAWIGIVRGGGAGTNNACREPGHAVDDAVNARTKCHSSSSTWSSPKTVVRSPAGAEHATSKREKDHDD